MNYMAVECIIVCTVQPGSVRQIRLCHSQLASKHFACHQYDVGYVCAMRWLHYRSFSGDQLLAAQSYSTQLIVSGSVWLLLSSGQTGNISCNPCPSLLAACWGTVWLQGNAAINVRTWQCVRGDTVWNVLTFSLVWGQCQGDAYFPLKTYIMYDWQ